jgi:protein O-GlcNAc transferase
LIDLNSHSNGAMMEALALKPAPTQITYLYHPSTSGAKFMDYCLVDEVVASMQDMELFSEKLLYLPDCYQVNDGKQPISDKAYSKTELGFGTDDFIFCCFNAPWKIEADIFEIWMRILDKTPNAKLWLLRFNDTACENIKKAATNAGIDSARIVFADNMPKDEHLARLRIADLLLDTRPYNAHTTASDALFVGVPVLTVRGDSFASRVAESLLVNAGLGKELVAKDLCEYEQMALVLAASNDEIAKYKSFLNAHAKTCALFDTKKFVSGLETVLKRV